MKTNEWPKTEVFHHAWFPPVKFEFVPRNPSYPGCAWGYQRPVRIHFHFLFTVLFHLLWCSLLLHYLLHLFLLPSVLSFLIIPSLRHSSSSPSSLLHRFSLPTPFSPHLSFSYSLFTSFIPFPILLFLPFLLLPLQCPVQSSYPFTVWKDYNELGRGSIPSRSVLLSTAPRPDLEATHPPIQWVPGALSSRGRAAEAWS